MSRAALAAAVALLVLGVGVLVIAMAVYGGHIPLEDGSFSTRDIGRGAIYEVTYVTEEVARAVAKARPAHPVQSWSVRSLGLLDAHVVDCDPDDLADPGEDAGDESDDVAGPL